MRPVSNQPAEHIYATAKTHKLLLLLLLLLLKLYFILYCGFETILIQIKSELTTISIAQTYYYYYYYIKYILIIIIITIIIIIMTILLIIISISLSLKLLFVQSYSSRFMKYSIVKRFAYVTSTFIWVQTIDQCIYIFLELFICFRFGFSGSAFLIF